MEMYTKDILVGGKKITLQTGKLAPQTNASVVAQYGNTTVLATVIMGKTDDSKDYFPLSIEFVDKLYAGGIVKGGKWIKRDGGPSDSAVLFGRIIDRSLRPLFPSDFMNEVQIIATVLSNDKDNDVVIPAFTAAAAALAISDIPFNGPVSAVRVGYINDQLTLNPSSKELEKSNMDLLVCTSPAGVNMIECDANIVANDIALKGIELAKTTSDEVNKEITAWAKECGKEKIKYESAGPSADLIKEIESKIKADVEAFLEAGVDGSHMAGQEKIVDQVLEAYEAKIESEEISKNHLIAAVDSVIRTTLRIRTLKGIRFDHRKMDEIRPLTIEVGVLPCVHGSAFFQRGLTQAITVTTLAPLSEKQYLEDSSGETTKRYLHYYSAQPFSTGQTGRVGRPGRREIGHGALAEKALIPVIPTEEEFPYTIVLTSEVLSQNGSSSMASTCGSTMSLMDAGVPIKDKVAGISIGLVAETDDNYVLLTDIAGTEDHNGDMDFKITGTRNGITAIQLDIKRAGLTLKMITDTFVASTKARLQILDKMESVLAAPRAQLSEFAPKIKMVALPEDKIGEVIGSGGKTIKALMEKYDVQIDIDDFGKASISSQNQENIDKAAYEIESMIKEVEIGEDYEGIVTRVEAYGAFVEFLPGREALLHVSEMSGGFLSDPSSIIKVGDHLNVKIAGFNDNHQIKLASPEFKAAHPGQPREEGQGQDNRTGGFRNFTPPRRDDNRSGGFRPRR
ncbi:MAG: polyribonucleotide nucleotidyltransferase [Candidatus Shapirobacteria bacterium]|nr:polyribonucleotide nucleotidyltransferase [Candidatus Shapirobacteria bacterium]MDD4410755.1 polyribonucleotide nucleotidyltransferase [Candidatus Shapirobacteria bacterium]